MPKTKVCENCKYASTALNPLKAAKDGKMIHKSHFSDPNSKYFGKQK